MTLSGYGVARADTPAIGKAKSEAWTLEEFEAVYEDVGMRRRAQPAGHSPTPPTSYRKSMMSSRMG